MTTLFFIILLRTVFMIPTIIIQRILQLIFVGVEEEQLPIDVSHIKVENLNYDYYNLNGGDKAKFRGMWYHALRTEEAWKIVLEHFDWDKNEFTRNEPNSNGWSSDMMAGILLAITTRWKEGLLTQEEKQFMFDYVWKMNFKLWFPYKQDMEDLSRGFLWKPFAPIFNTDNLKPLLLLKLATSLGIGGWKKYVLILYYYLMLFVSLPYFYLGGLWSALFFFNTKYVKFYSSWSYTTHSTALYCVSGIMLGVLGSKFGLKKLYRRHKGNLDIFTLYKIYIEGKLSDNDLLHIDYKHKALLYSRDKVNQIPYESASFFEVKNFEFKEIATKQINTFRCNDNTWERNAIDRGFNNLNQGDLDIVYSLELARM